MKPDPYWFRCCIHCECEPDERIGHDDTCAQGCNDHEMATEDDK